MLPSAVQPALYEQQLDQKTNYIKNIFSKLHNKKLAVYPSPPHSYRMRSEFRIWHTPTQCHYCMFDPCTKKPVYIDTFLACSQRIQNLMPCLLQAINNNQKLSHRLFQLEFLTTLSGDALITMIYHCQLDDGWQNIATDLSKELNISIVGRCKNNTRVITKNYVHEILTVNNKKYQYQQMENSFTQPNAYVNQHMLSWAQIVSHKHKNSKKDLLELFCGNGNFTCVLANQFNRILATERAKTSIASAEKNFTLNQLNNIQIARLSSEEVVQAINNTRSFYRLRNITLSDYNFSTVLVDPPRMGLDPNTLALIQNFKQIIYFSCNHETLQENLKSLMQTHCIEDFALFDQFPYTHHIELGISLVRS